MTALSAINGYGVAASRPSAGIPGRTYYASDTDVLSRDNGATWNNLAPGGGASLPVGGTTGQVLTKQSGTDGDADWATPGGAAFVGASVYRSTNQSIGNNASASISFAAENYDTDAFHDNSTNPTRVTIPSGKDGYYRITGTFIFADNATGVRYAILELNNATSLDDSYVKPSGTGDAAYLRVMREIALVAGDYVELQAFQNSGGALNVLTSGTYTPRLDIHKIG